MEKILISACFLGARVRYDAEIIPLEHELITLWHQQGRLVVICPEVTGGLPTPRPPAEIQRHGDTQVIDIITVTGNNVTEPFMKGAQAALALCKQHNIHYALLKESSPSCGSQFIYDGTFSGTKIKGQGVTTQLLQAHNVLVYSEKNIAMLAQKMTN